MKKRILSIFLCLVLVLCFLPVTAWAVTTVDKIPVTLAYPEAKQVKQAKKDGLVDRFIYGSISASYLVDIVDSL